MSKDYNVYARLRIGGAEVPISDFSFDFPEDSIGGQLTATMANQTQAIDEDEDIVFEIGIAAGGATEWVPIMDLGKIKSVSTLTGWPGDQVAIRAVSALADKWDLSPPQPITLYDPDQVDVVSSNASTFGDLVNEAHQFIGSELLPVRSLDLIRLLNWVYVDKLGFAGVVTNIENFPIKTVNVAISDAYHSVAAREVGVFEPTYHADDHGTLWIIDPQGTLPSGLTARAMRLKHYAKLEKSIEVGRLVNQVVLSYRDNLAVDSSPTIRSEKEIINSGEFGDPDWQRSTTTSYIYDFHDDPAHPDHVTRSVVFRVRTEVSAVADGLTRLVSIDDQTDTYKYDYRLNTGYTKQASLYCRLPGESAKLRLVHTEVKEIEWEELTSRPGEFIKQNEVTQISGLVLKTQDDPDDDSTITRQPLYTANRLNDIPEEAEVESGRPISTKIETFREVGPDQIEVNAQQVNHLTPQAAPDPPRTYQHTGTIRANISPQQPTTNMLIVAEGTSDDNRRPPISLAAGNVPFTQAKRLALRELDRRNNKPARVTAELSGLDLALRRGSIRTVHDRQDNTYKTYIKGFSGSGSGLGTPDRVVMMRISGVVLND